MGKGSTDTKDLRRISYLLISRMSQIDPRMIRGRSDGIQSDDRSQRWKVQRLPEEIRRLDGDPTRSEIREYHLEVESRLSIAAGDTRVRTLVYELLRGGRKSA